MSKVFDTMQLNTFKERLAWLLDVSGLPGRRLQALAGVSATYASAVSRGRLESPTGKTASALARCFGVEEGWLLSGRGETPDENDVKRRVRRKLRLVGKAA